MSRPSSPLAARTARAPDGTTITGYLRDYGDGGDMTAHVRAAGYELERDADGTRWYQCHCATTSAMVPSDLRALMRSMADGMWTR